MDLNPQASNERPRSIYSDTEGASVMFGIMFAGLAGVLFIGCKLVK